MSEEIKEQVKYDWKEQRIAEYAKIENEIILEKHEMVTDPDLFKLMKEQAKLNDMIALTKGIYTKNIEAAQQQQAGIKLELVDTWGDIEEKAFECDAGTATLRTTKSLHVRSKEKLIEFLMTIKKLPEFVKTFEIAKLRKIMDAGLLESEIATWDLNFNVAISIKETTTETDQ